MPKVKLTDRFVASATSNGKPQEDFFDEVTKGLALRVSITGLKGWNHFFTSPRDGKRARCSLGRYPAASLAAARGKSIEAARQVAEGRDPRLTSVDQAAAHMTVADLVEVYLADPGQAVLRSVAEKARRLRRNVVPVLGDVKLSELRRRDVRNVIEPIMRRGKATEAARVYEDFRAMLRWGVKADFLDRNPAEGTDKPPVNGPRERTLSDAESRTLWNSLPKSLARSKQCQRIVKLCLVTAQRVGEVAGMRRDELDLGAALWSLPGSRTKNANPHTVPLSPLAVEIIEEALAEAGESPFVFPAGEGSLSAEAVARTILRANGTSEERPLGRFGIAPWSAHDLRRTALTGMAKLGVLPIVLGHVANHRSTTRAGVTLSVYSQYQYDAEKRTALVLWATWLRDIVECRT